MKRKWQSVAYFMGGTPQISELASMMGHTSNYPCRTCESTKYLGQGDEQPTEEQLRHGDLLA
ncbi:hypothetical protein BC828DRAFT_413264, partial [Blastocladiella britannica]